MSASYPYLTVAKRWEINYSEVLAFIETIENKTFVLDSALDDWQHAALVAWYDEHERRKKVLGA